MQIEDPVAWAQGAAAFKSVFDGLRSAIAMLKDLKGNRQPSREGELIDAALDKASKATAIAEAEIAKVLGYELCKCEFPPVPMLAVGTHNWRSGITAGGAFMNAQNANSILRRHMDLIDYSENESPRPR